MVAQRRRRGERGQTIIEFALLFPLIAIFLFAIVDFGLAISERSVLADAAREGARVGALGGDVGAITDCSVEASAGLLDPGDVTVSWSDVNGDGFVGEAGDSVVVRVEHEYTFISPLSAMLGAFGASGPTEITLGSCADMRLEVSNSSATGGGTGCD